MSGIILHNNLHEVGNGSEVRVVELGDEFIAKFLRCRVRTQAKVRFWSEIADFQHKVNIERSIDPSEKNTKNLQLGAGRAALCTRIVKNGNEKERRNLVYPLFRPSNSHGSDPCLFFFLLSSMICYPAFFFLSFSLRRLCDDSFFLRGNQKNYLPSCTWELR